MIFLFIMIWAFIGHTFWLFSIRKVEISDGPLEAFVMMFIMWLAGPLAWAAYVYRHKLEEYL